MGNGGVGSPADFSFESQIGGVFVSWDFKCQQSIVISFAR